ncbi:gliding motility-associated C-terminal domain-containing protein, partial [Flavobacterium sp.]|uniref:T9SS type B sorting domain-containing protein n=1 Tax=Flavobacterium sp. TaxID=239 RepID=UPI003BDAFC63
SGSYTVTASAGACTSPASAPAVINAKPTTLVTPILSVVTQPTCNVAIGSFTITNFNATYSYAVTPATGVTIVGNIVTAPSGSYTVTASSGACTSPTSAPAVINGQPTTLVTPILSVVTQPTCSVATGSFTITNYNVAYTYAVTPETGVTIIGNIVTAPSGSYVVTASIGSCSSPVSVPTIINLFNNSACASIALIKKALHNDLNNDGYAQAGETITYTFTVANTGLVSLSNITISDPLPGIVIIGGPISLGVGAIDSFSFIGVYTITIQDEINESVTNQATVYGTSPNGGIVNDLSDSSSISGNNGTVLLLMIKACKLDVFNAVTPNNDGNNEYLFIKGIDCYTDNSIEIYNRWGVKVYETQGYDNSTRAFRGYSEGRVTINKSEPLPYGTYYYILKYKDYNSNVLTKTGFLYLTL